MITKKTVAAVKKKHLIYLFYEKMQLHIHFFKMLKFIHIKVGRQTYDNSNDRSNLLLMMKELSNEEANLTVVGEVMVVKIKLGIA